MLGRIKNRSEFQSILRTGSVYRGKYVVLYRTEDHSGENHGNEREGNESYAGYIAAKRSIGNAVARNRAKRIMREGMRAILNMLPPGEYVLVARRHCLYAKSTDIAEDVLRMLKRS